MREIILEAEVRTQMRKHSRAIRREGKVPGVYYVHGENNIPITVLEKSLKPLIYTSETHIINLKLSDGAKNCILRDIQFDPLTDRPIHFDLQGLRENEEITVEVPVVITGTTPVGVRDGGILQHTAHRLKISCLPRYIPEHIEVDASEIKINHFVHVRDLKLENITFLDNENNTIVGVIPPTVEKEETAAVAVTESAEPEVIGKGKKVEEGAEAEAPSAEKKPETPAKEEKKK